MAFLREIARVSIIIKIAANWLQLKIAVKFPTAYTRDLGLPS